MKSWYSRQRVLSAEFRARVPMRRRWRDYATEVKGNDPCAMHTLAFGYGLGHYGLPVDQAKSIDLLRQSAGHGYPPAQYKLGNNHLNGDMGFEQNEEEELRYMEKAAEGGHLIARHNIGCAEGSNGNHAAAMRNLRLAASGGYVVQDVHGSSSIML